MENWIWDALRYTFMQAFWSAAASVTMGWALARFVSWQRSSTPLLGLSLLPFALPTVLISFAWVLTYGNSGMVNKMIQALFGTQIQFLYTGNALIFAHIFIYLGFCWNFMSLAYERIPGQFLKSSKMLGLSPWQQFRFLEFPWLKWTALQCFIIVFLYCLTTFALAVSLGAGPENSTSEVLVYQLIKYEFNTTLALKVASLQIVLGLVVASALWFLPATVQAPVKHEEPLKQKQVASQRTFLSFTIVSIRRMIVSILFLFLSLPLLALTLDTLKNTARWGDFGQEFWSSLFVSFSQSLTIALCVGASTPYIAFLIMRSLKKTADNPTAPGKLSQALSSKSAFNVLTWFFVAISPTLMGAFLSEIFLLSGTDFAWKSQISTYALHTIFALPLCCRILEQPLEGLSKTHKNTISLLNLSPIQTIALIEWPACRRSLLLCTTLAFTFSLGELGASSLLSTENFNPLPVLLLELMGSYRFAEATLVASLLLCFSLVSLFVYYPAPKKTAQRSDH